MLQLLEDIIHHGEIKPLGCAWQAVAFAVRALGRLGHSTLTHSVNKRTQVLIDKKDVCLCCQVLGAF